MRFKPFPRSSGLTQCTVNLPQNKYRRIAMLTFRKQLLQSIFIHVNFYTECSIPIRRDLVLLLENTQSNSI